MFFRVLNVFKASEIAGSDPLHNDLNNDEQGFSLI